MSPIVSGGGGGSSPVLAATKHLGATDLLTLNTVSVSVVAAAGANKVILPLGGLLQFHAGATPYDGFANSNVDLVAAGTETAAGFSNANYGWNFASDILDGAVDAAISAKMQTADVFAIAPPSALANKALVIFSEHANPTQGNGTADLTVWYAVATLL